MEDIDKIEKELVTKLEELGFKTKHGYGQIGYEHGDIGLYGRISVFSDEITWSLNLDVVGGYLPLLQLHSFNCSKVEEIVFLHSAVVEYLKELKKSCIDFCALVQSMGATAIDKDVVDKYLDHFKNTAYDSKLGYTFEYSGIFSILNVRLGDTLDLVVTLRDGNCECVIYNSRVTDETCEEVFDTVDGLIEDFRVNCCSYRGLIKIVQNNTL